MERRMTILLTPETKTKRRPSSAQPNSRKSRGSRRHLGASSRGVAATSPTATSPTTNTHHYTNEKNLINKTKTTSFLCSFTLHHTKKEAATSIPPQWKKVWATMADTCWSPGCHNISKITSTKRTIHSQTRHSSNNWKKKIKNSCWCARLLLGGTFSCAAQQHNGTPRGVPS